MDQQRQHHEAIRRQQQQQQHHQHHQHQHHHHQHQQHQQQQPHERHQLQQQFQFMANHYAGVHHLPENVTAVPAVPSAINNFGIIPAGSTSEASPFAQAPFASGSDNSHNSTALYHPGHPSFFATSSDQQQQLHIPYQRQLAKAAAITAMDLRSSPASFFGRMPTPTQTPSQQGANSPFNHRNPHTQTTAGNNFGGSASSWIKAPSSPLDKSSLSLPCNNLKRKSPKTNKKNNSSTSKIFSSASEKTPPENQKQKKQDENLFDDEYMEAIDWDIPEPTPLPPVSQEVSKNDNSINKNLLPSLPKYENTSDNKGLDIKSPTIKTSSLNWPTSSQSHSKTKAKKRRSTSTSHTSIRSPTPEKSNKSSTILDKSNCKKSPRSSSAKMNKPTPSKTSTGNDKMKANNQNLSSTKLNIKQTKQISEAAENPECNAISSESEKVNTESPALIGFDINKSNKKNLSVLKTWVNLPQHFDYPYPNDEEKKDLSELSGLNPKSLEIWFINYRQRRWKKTKDDHNKNDSAKPDDSIQSYESIRMEIEKMIGDNQSKKRKENNHVTAKKRVEEKKLKSKNDKKVSSEIVSLISTGRRNEDLGKDSQKNVTNSTLKNLMMKGKSCSGNIRNSEEERRKRYVAIAMIQSKYSWPEKSRETFNAIVDFCRKKENEYRSVYKGLDQLSAASSTEKFCGTDGNRDFNKDNVKPPKNLYSFPKTLHSDTFSKEKSLVDLLLFMRNNYFPSESDILSALGNLSSSYEESIDKNDVKPATNESDSFKILQSLMKNKALLDATNFTKEITVNLKDSTPTTLSLKQKGSTFVILVLIKIEIPQSTDLKQKNNLLHRKNTKRILGSATISQGGKIIRHLTSDVMETSKLSTHNSSSEMLNAVHTCAGDSIFGNNESFPKPAHNFTNEEKQDISIGEKNTGNQNIFLYHSIESWIHNLPKIHSVMKGSSELLGSNSGTTNYFPKDTQEPGIDNILLLVTSGSDQFNTVITGNLASALEVKDKIHKQFSSTTDNYFPLLNNVAIRIPFDTDKNVMMDKNVLSLLPLSSVINQKDFPNFFAKTTGSMVGPAKIYDQDKLNKSLSNDTSSHDLVQSNIKKNKRIKEENDLKLESMIGKEDLTSYTKETRYEGTCLIQNKTNLENSHVDSQLEIDNLHISSEHKYDTYELESCVFLRNFIHSCFHTKGDIEEQEDLAYPICSMTDMNYSNAPLGEIWVKTLETELSDQSTISEAKTIDGDTSQVSKTLLSLSHSKKKAGIRNERQKKWIVGEYEPPLINSGGSLLGRRWIWDEGYFTDCNCITEVSNSDNRQKLVATSMKGYLQSMNGSYGLIPKENDPVPIYERAYCNCGKQHKVFHGQNRRLEHSASNIQPGRTRRSERSGTSVSMSHVLAELASGKLNPHTLITCDEYSVGPEFRHLVDEANFSCTMNIGDESEDSKSNNDEHSKRDDISDPKTNLWEDTKLDSFNISTVLDILPNLKRSQIQPFAVKVSPDAAFLTDLHSHLSDSEIIGLLGGRYVPSERCIYIQAAFPCKATSRADSGYTDVEMDPVSQIIAGDAIVRYGMTVVGWYHSHPTFQPDPSVTDIENQGNYQRLFQSVNKSHSQSNDDKKEKNDDDLASSVDVTDTSSTQHEGDISTEPLKVNEETTKNSGDDVIPFVGLIVGTYDGRNPTSKSVMKWFHVTKKGGDSQRQETGLLNETDLDQKIESLGRSSSKNVAKKEVYFPMNLQVTHRKFRNILGEKSFPGDHSKFKSFRKSLTKSGTSIRREEDHRALLSSLYYKSALLNKQSNVLSAKSFCEEIEKTEEKPSSFSKCQSEKSDPKLEKLFISNDLMGDEKGTIILKNQIPNFTQPSAMPPQSTTASLSNDNKIYNGFASDIIDEAIANDDNVYDGLLTKKSLDSRGFLENFFQGVQLTNTIMPEFIKTDSSTKSNFISTAGKDDTKQLSILYSRSYDSFNPNGTGNSIFIKAADLKERFCYSQKNVFFHNFDDYNFQPAHPLPFTAKELEILDMKQEDGVTDDICAGIIWNAVEREQIQSVTTRNFDCAQPKMPRPASSNSILELLLLPSKPQNCFGKFLNNESEQQDSHFCDDDAILVHTIDAVISHYATDSHKINPFESWSGAGDKGFQDIDSSVINHDGNESQEHAKPANSWWKRYYSIEVLGRNCPNKGAQGVSAINYKMKRGHKITACLLSWATNMQLNQRLSFNVAKKFSLWFQSDNETARPSSSVEFVAEIMRLLAARWRESSNKEKSSKKKSSQNKNAGNHRPKKKRGRPPLSSYTIPSRSKAGDKNAGIISGKKIKRQKKK